MDKRNSLDFENFKEKLKESNDIVTVISKYVNLERKGKRYWGCCPFHMEKTPSFAVLDDGQYYICYGCKATGDVITFIQKIENCDFIDACKILAKNANLEMPSFTNDENVIKQKKEKDELYRCLKDAALYYYHNLNNPDAKVALDYINKRKLSMATVTNFGIGYSLGWSDVIYYLAKKGYSLDTMLKAGIAELKTDPNNPDNKLDPKNIKNYYDCYAKRLVFPIINSLGNVVGFSARLLEDANFAKYKNTSQTSVFDKSKCVFSINQIKKLKSANELKEVIIVEGQMDVISLYQAGVKNAVACMGTALTGLHAKELKKFTDKVVVCFDGDGAGQKATLRSIDTLVKGGLDVYVVKMPDKLDPDEYIQKYGKDGYLNLIASAKYWVEFLIYNYLEGFDISKPNQKINYINSCLNVISQLATDSERTIYLDILKSITSVPVEILKKDMANIGDAKIDVDKVETKETLEVLPSKENAYVKAVKFVIASLLHGKSYSKLNDSICENLLNNDFVTIYNYIKRCAADGKQPIVSNVFDMFDVENNEDVRDIVAYEFNKTCDNEKFYDDCVVTMIEYGLKHKQEQLLKQIKECRDMNERKVLTAELNKIIMKSKNKER